MTNPWLFRFGPLLIPHDARSFMRRERNQSKDLSQFLDDAWETRYLEGGHTAKGEVHRSFAKYPVIRGKQAANPPLTRSTLKLRTVNNEH